MDGVFRQVLFIPSPPLTEKNCPDQTGRVFIVTGGYSGLGFELCKILYSHNAIVYVAGRSESKASDAISDLKKAFPESSGRLEAMIIDLFDLSTIKPGVEAFLAQQTRLDVLVNNAGIMLTGSTEPEHNEIHIRTNCVGPSLLYKQLLPLLTKTAASSPTGSVRVLWAASLAVQANAPKPGGMKVDDAGRPKDVEDVMVSYAQSKVGNVFLSREYAKTTPQTGVVHASFNPGNLRTPLQRHWSGLLVTFIRIFLCFEPIYGAYTELWCALAPELTPANSGSYVYPWGRFGHLPAGTELSLKDPSEGGTGLAAKFVLWCEKQAESHI